MIVDLSSIQKSYTSLIDGSEYNVNTFYKHLRYNGLDTKQYVEVYILGYTPLCECLSPLKFYQGTWKYAKSCGNPKCVGKQVKVTKNSWTEDQRKSDADHKREAALSMSPEVRSTAKEKAIKTSLKKHGVTFVTQSTEFKEKSKATKLERYGDEYYNNSEKSAEANRSKTPDEQMLINTKREQSVLKNYGVINTLLLAQTKHNARKGNATSKPYTLPSGKVLQIRGFEHIALDELLQHYNENDFVIHDWSDQYTLPIFEYENTKGTKSHYHPDIYIPHENKIIEIKSQWWWDGNGREKYNNRLLNNLKKRQAVLDAGYEYEVWIYDCRGTKCEVLSAHV